MQGPYVVSLWLGWSCSEFQVAGCLDALKWEASSFKEIWVWVSWGLGSLLQKHLPLVKPSGGRPLGRPRPNGMFSLGFTFSLEVIEMK